MSKFDDFDLDLQGKTNEADSGVYSTGTAQTYYPSCQTCSSCDGCGQNTISACRSYCGSSC